MSLLAPRPSPTLYPPRGRATNVALIRAVRDAPDQAAFEAADRELAASLHPSLLAELDWMEMTMPEARREAGGRFVDGLFLHHLGAFLRLRAPAFEAMDDAALAADVALHPDFWTHLAEQAPEALAELGEVTGRRALEHLREPQPGAEERARATLDDEAARRAADVAAAARDPAWLALLVEADVKNTLAALLDHPSSRMRAKRFLRARGGLFPRLAGAEPTGAEAAEGVRRRLRELAAEAEAHGLPELEALARALAAACEAWRPADPDAFGGERAGGYGPCGRCAMMFASTAVVSFDPTCPDLIDDVTGRVYLPLDFAIATCPFCGDRARVEAPALFYAPARNQVVHNAPRAAGLSEAEALEMHRPVLEALRERYKARVGPDAARAFDEAGVDITYGTGDFLLAIQMGTTAREVHAYNVARLADGSGLLVDPTKNVMIELTPREMAGRQDIVAGPAPDAPGPPAADAPPEPEGSMADAHAAFAARDYSRARDILSALHARAPGDDVVRKNLAVALLSLGDRDGARRALGR